MSQVTCLIHARGSSSASTQCSSRILQNLAAASHQIPIDDTDALLRLPALLARREFPFKQDSRTVVFVLDLERIHEKLVENIQSQQAAFGYFEDAALDDGTSTLLSDLQAKCRGLAMQLLQLF
jgi:hypothetical protein